MSESQLKVPADGQKITMGADGRLAVPDRPIVPFIEGDGTGPDTADPCRMGARTEPYGGEMGERADAAFNRKDAFDLYRHHRCSRTRQISRRA